MRLLVLGLVLLLLPSAALAQTHRGVVLSQLDTVTSLKRSEGAQQSGPHLLMVSMASCNTELCYFGFRALTR